MKKSEKGSISMIVFVTVMFMMVVLGTLLTTISAKSKSQLVEQQKLKNAYDGDMRTIFEERNAYVTTSGGGD